MVEFFKDEACTDRLTEFRLDDSYVEDMYGGVIENVVEVDTTVTKTIYLKNFDADMVAIRSITSDSEFLTFVPENVRLGTGEVTAVHVTFAPTTEVLEGLNSITDPDERNTEKRKLLQSDIVVDMYRVMM